MLYSLLLATPSQVRSLSTCLAAGGPETAAEVGRRGVAEALAARLWYEIEGSEARAEVANLVRTLNPWFSALNPWFSALNPWFSALNPWFSALNPWFYALCFLLRPAIYVLTCLVSDSDSSCPRFSASIRSPLGFRSDAWRPRACSLTGASC